MISKLISGVDSFLLWFNSGMLKRSLEDYVHLDTANSTHYFINKDGSMTTLISLAGSREMVGNDQLNNMRLMLSEGLGSYFNGEGYKLQFVFYRDDERTRENLENIIAPYKNQAKRNNLNFDDIYDEKVNSLAKYTSYEKVYIVATTLLSSSTGDALKEDDEKYREEIGGKPPFVNAANFAKKYDSIENNHFAFIQTINKSLKDSGLKAGVLRVHDAMKDIMKIINPGMISEEWEPTLAGDKIPLKKDINITTMKNDISSLLWPKIGSQLFLSNSERVRDDIVKMGDYYYSPLSFIQTPKRFNSFNQLVGALNDQKEIPFLISFTIRGVRQWNLMLKSIMTDLNAWTNSETRLLRDSMEFIKDAIDSKEPVCEMSIAAITWAKELKTLERNRLLFLRYTQGWGSPVVEFAKGDVDGAVLSTFPAVTKNEYAPISYAPLREAISLLPITRPANIWDDGSMILRTAGTRIFPYQPGSSKQNAWNNIYFATPGSGKSVMLNAINLANLSTLGYNDLPLIGILDIGISSGGLVEMIRSQLPDNMKHLAVAQKLKNSEEYAINILDTPVGARMLKVEDLFSAVNMIVIALTPASRAEEYPSTSDMVQAIVKAAYEKFSDRKEPKMYARHMVNEIDEAIDKHNLASEIDFDGDVTWWQLTDKFFEKGDHLSATRAQRFAVPTLPDLVSVAHHNQTIKEKYSKVEIETGENLIDFFSRSIGELVDRYPMLAIPTTFDLSAARIISLDLQEVAPEGDGEAKKQTSLMYVLGRYIITRNFFIDEELLRLTPKIYHDYYGHKIENQRITPKVLSYDEFHRTAGIEGVRQQVVRDMREGRKWRMQVNLVSQLLDDFSREIIEMVDGIFILSGGDSADKVAKIFNLDRTMTHILKTQITGPTAAGAPFIYKSRTKEGDYTMFLHMTLGSIELWAYNTTAEDCALRDRLAQRVGQSKARQYLAEYFPGGSAKSHMESISEDKLKGRTPMEYIISGILKAKNILD